MLAIGSPDDWRMTRWSDSLGVFAPPLRLTFQGRGGDCIATMRWQDFSAVIVNSKANAAFKLNGFDDQERNLMFVKTAFLVLKLKFFPTVRSKLSILFTNKMLSDLDNKKMHLYKLFVRYLIVKPACVNAA